MRWGVLLCILIGVQRYSFLRSVLMISLLPGMCPLP